MTMLHTGSTKKFASGWENVFAGQGGRTAKPATKTVAKKAAGGKHRATAGKKQSTAKTGKRR